MNKKSRRKQELEKLIDEQQKELKQEKKLVFSRGGTKSYQKGRKGIFVGNKIF